MNTLHELSGMAALAGLGYAAWILWGKASRHVGTSRLGLIGLLALIKSIFWR
jgi:hypothetical protein